MKPHRWQHTDGDTWCVDCGRFSRHDDGDCRAQECGDFDADSAKGNARILGLITGNEVPT